MNHSVRGHQVGSTTRRYSVKGSLLHLLSGADKAVPQLQSTRASSRIWRSMIRTPDAFPFSQRKIYQGCHARELLTPLGLGAQQSGDTPISTSSSSRESNPYQEGRGGGIPFAHLQVVRYFRQQPAVLLAKYHPAGNYRHCWTQMGLNATSSATWHSPPPAVSTQVCIPEPLHLPTTKIIFFKSGCFPQTSHVKCLKTVPPELPAEGHNHRQTVVWAVPCTSHARWQAGTGQPLPLPRQKWWETEFAVCQCDAAIFTISSSVQSSRRSSLFDTGLQLLWNM